jgi:hypothetical protein
MDNEARTEQTTSPQACVVPLGSEVCAQDWLACPGGWPACPGCNSAGTLASGIPAGLQASRVTAPDFSFKILML